LGDNVRGGGHRRLGYQISDAREKRPEELGDDVDEREKI